MNCPSSLTSEHAVQLGQHLNRWPRASYRLQLRGDFDLSAAASVAEYLDRLGISDLYLSPLFKSRDESSHGYDVVDHNQIEPSFGGMDAFHQLASECRSRDIGILLDIVPNHMGINDSSNTRWIDVLENGAVARNNLFFDIDWQPPGAELTGRVLLPFLGRPLGETIEAGELRIELDENRFYLNYFERRFPLCYRSWEPILTHADALLPDSASEQSKTELKSIVTHIRRLPTPQSNDEQGVEEQYREQDVIRKRLHALASQCEHVRHAIEKAIEEINGIVGQPESFNTLEEILQRQYYRLAFWRNSVDEINYRRFFDVNDLAAIRVENPLVFHAVHDLTFRLLEKGLVTGLRIDHPDGLIDPEAYFDDLQTMYLKSLPDDASKSFLYVVAEKILSGDESLPSHWAICGTTGYEFLNQISGILVATEGVDALRAFFSHMTGDDRSPRDFAYQGKQTILHESMASELFVLASRLYRVARKSRASYDFPLPVLLRALREIIACFPVYRTYVRPVGWEVNNDDHGRIREAVRWAKYRNPTMSWAAFDYISTVLLLEFPSQLSDELRSEWRHIVLKFQQVTGPITAKGIEDTAFYRYFPLASLNEVGGELGAKGIDCDTFHREMTHRFQDWPAAMSSTATHDTKRGEDMRARLHVLSEIPHDYVTAFEQWDEQIQSLCTRVEDREIPDKASRYLIHQTLIGTWPFEGLSETNSAEYLNRLQTYFEKAFREAKLHTSWMNPSERFEKGVREFLKSLLNDPRSPWVASTQKFVNRVAGAGYVNSLASVVLKGTLPGVPDFYQGSEIWDFRLVDPDNRRPVDFSKRAAMLAALREQHAAQPLQALTAVQSRWSNELKLLVTHCVLQARRDQNQLFQYGAYQPLEVEGEFANHVIAFARRYNGNVAITAVPRLPSKVLKHSQDGVLDLPIDFTGHVWGDTRILLPESMSHRWHDAFSLSIQTSADRTLPVAKLFEHLCVALLVSSKE